MLKFIEIYVKTIKKLKVKITVKKTIVRVFIYIAIINKIIYYFGIYLLLIIIEFFREKENVTLF